MTDANDIPAIEDDVNTTMPQSKPQAWTMPDPVFRRTSGKLPKGFEEDAGFSDRSDSNHVSEPPAQSAPVVEPKPNSPTLKLLVVALGLLAMIAFIAVFLTVVYFYFLR